METTELKALAKAAFGPDWKMALADKAGCTRETLWRYEQGLTPVSTARAFIIRAVCADQITANIERQQAVLKRYPQAVKDAAVGMPKAPTLKPADIERRAKKILGRAWVRLLATEVGVTPQTIRNWSSGAIKMGPERESEMLTLLKLLPGFKYHGLLG